MINQRCKHDEYFLACRKCLDETKALSKSASAQGSAALYWIDFEHKKHDEEVRLQVMAGNLEEARKKAEIYISKRFKIKKVHCVR